jgi:hypothetical protein
MAVKKSDEDIWIKVDFTEHELEEYNTQANSSDKDNKDDYSYQLNEKY